MGMQSYRDDEVVDSAVMPMGEIQKALAQKVAEMEDGDIDHVVIGRMPQVNELVTVNGLKFVILASGPEMFTAEIFKPPTKRVAAREVLRVPNENPNI